MHIPKEVVDNLWSKRPELIERVPFSDGSEEDALLLYLGVGLLAYLRKTGEIFEVDAFLEDNLRPVDDNTAMEYVAIAIRRGEISELRAAQPARPASASTCSTCGGPGFASDDPENPEFFVCEVCHGLGWIAR